MDSSHHKIGHAAPLKRGSVFDHRMQIGADPDLDAGSGGGGNRHGLAFLLIVQLTGVQVKLS